jgi:HD superfamily phosphohydrolase
LIIRDPVHGDVEFTEPEVQILDCRELQRLRGIKQLGTAYLVYPGALHTRFDHSIGTMAIAKRIIESLRSKGHEVGKGEEETIAIAALLHDISHVPFGHTFEDERKILPGHEKGDRLDLLLSDGELGDALEDLGLAKEAVSILMAKEPIERNHPEPWMAQIVKDAISADLLDYLRRDSYFAGLTQDYDDRLFRYFIIAGVEVGGSDRKVLAVDLGKEGMVRQDARSEVLHLLRMRYFLTERVYYHHAKQASGAMVSKALEMSLRDGLDPSDLLWMSDWTLFEALKARDPPPAPVGRLVEGVRSRKLLKRSFVLGPEIGAAKRNEMISLYNRPGPEREEMEARIISELGKRGISADEGDVIIHCPDLGAMKEARVFARDEEGMVEKLHRHRRSLSRDLDPIENQYLAIWKFLVFSQARWAVTVHEVCSDLFSAERPGYLPKNYHGRTTDGW